MTPAIPPDEVDHRFRHHPPTTAHVAERHEEVRERCAALAHELNALLPRCPEAIAAIDAVDDACKHANAAIARYLNYEDMNGNSQLPPAARDLPPGVLEAATSGAAALDASALTPYGQNLLAHALARLEEKGYLRSRPEDETEPDPYVWDLLRAYLSGGAIAFDDHRVPVAVMGRLRAAAQVGTIDPDRLPDQEPKGQYTADVPAYAWEITEALATGRELDFNGELLPRGVADAIESATATAATEEAPGE